MQLCSFCYSVCSHLSHSVAWRKVHASVEHQFHQTPLLSLLENECVQRHYLGPQADQKSILCQ